MNSWIESLDFSIFGAALLLSAMGLWFVAILPRFDRWSRHFFLGYFVILMLCCLSGIVEVILQQYNASRLAFVFLLLLETMLLALLLPMSTAFLLYHCGENLRTSRLLHIALGLCAVLLLVLVSAPFSEGFFYVTPQNEYFRGPLYPLIVLPMIAIQLLTLVGTVRYRRRLSRKVFFAFLIALLPIVVALTAQLFFDVFPLIDFSYLLSALVMYSLILSDQIEQDRSRQQEIVRQQQKISLQQREIAHERASIMALQMRPHFIYNTLMSIHSLCSLDPKKAQQITMDFTNYLRRNFNAVVSDRNVPFSTELEHTRAYLAVEQAQYDDMLVVEYDTPFTHFRLPPLTLQPIVENAVKHGMNPYFGPLRIFIGTHHTAAGAEIIVEDTGPGFDPSAESKPHAALSNIQQRLEMMCGGSMAIQPRDGGGTLVKLTIP
jgi:sensor histidine kinase YesM